jgi:hypothetical protein
MSLIVIGIVVFVLLILLTNTRRWKRLASGVRRAKSELESGARRDEP